MKSPEDSGWGGVISLLLMCILAVMLMNSCENQDQKFHDRIKNIDWDLVFHENGK